MGANVRIAVSFGVILGLLLLPVTLIEFVSRALIHCAYNDACGGYTDLVSGGAMLASVLVSGASGAFAGFGSFYLLRFTSQLFGRAR